MLKVKFKNTGEEVEAEEDAELKDVTKEKGWPIAYGCEDGMCGTCIIKTAPEGGGLSPMEEKEKNTLSVMGMGDGEHRLACQCKVKGDCEIEGM